MPPTSSPDPSACRCLHADRDVRLPYPAPTMDDDDNGKPGQGAQVAHRGRRHQCTRCRVLRAHETRVRHGLDRPDRVTPPSGYQERGRRSSRPPLPASHATWQRNMPTRSMNILSVTMRHVYDCEN